MTPKVNWQVDKSGKWRSKANVNSGGMGDIHSKTTRGIFNGRVKCKIVNPEFIRSYFVDLKHKKSLRALSFHIGF